MPMYPMRMVLDTSRWYKYSVHTFNFAWDPSKAVSNLRKHGVSFEEAQSVFHDEWALQFFDAEGSETEERYLMLGMSRDSRLLLVCHCESSDTIRLISARKATGNERKHYQGGYHEG